MNPNVNQSEDLTCLSHPLNETPSHGTTELKNNTIAPHDRQPTPWRVFVYSFVRLHL